MVRVHHIGLVPFTVPRSTYDATGRGVSFRDPSQHNAARTVYLTLFVYGGTAMVSLTGALAGPFIELGPGQSFDFHIETEAVFIKALTGTADVGIVAAVNPLEL